MTRLFNPAPSISLRVGVAYALIVVSSVFCSQLRAENYTFTTYAGSAGYGSNDGTGAAARFDHPRGVAMDSSGNVYVADSYNHTIRKITPGGVVSTLAGMAGIRGSADGKGAAARFAYPNGVAVDSSGNVYVAESYNNKIRKITPSGAVSTLAGGFPGSADGTGTAARFSGPNGVAVDSSGNVYVADTDNATIRKITPGGLVSTLAGTAGIRGSVDGTGAAAQFGSPSGVAVDSSGNVYVADNSTIRKITPGGVVSTLAGTAGIRGSADGTGSAAQFYSPSGVAVDISGNVYVADTFNQTIRKITLGGAVSTLAGTAGSVGSADGTGAASRFNYPFGVAVDSSGNVYVADTYNSTIRKITPGGAVSTLAGTAGGSGSEDGTGAAARFYFPDGVAVDSSGNVYVADTNNSTIRKITPGGAVSTLAGTAGSVGSADGMGAAARFAYPSGVAVDSSGNVYVADKYNNTIRKITPGGLVSTLAGSVSSYGSADGTGAAARFGSTSGVAVDSSGNVYVADGSNRTIRKITPGGLVSTLAGTAGFYGSADGTGAAAQFGSPSGVAVDSSGNVYVTDEGTIRKITPGGLVSTLAGSVSSYGYADGTGAAARFFRPRGVAVDSSGNVYVADTDNATIRKITPGGAVSTLAGTAGSYGYADGTGAAARFSDPKGVAVDSSGNVYVADTYNHTIRLGAPALADVAVIDSATGVVGVTRQLDTSSQTATSWAWSVVLRPGSSTAAFSSLSIRNPTFTPDVVGKFAFSLTATSPSGSSITTVSLNVAAGVPTANAQATNVSFNTAKEITLTGSDPDVSALTPTFNTPSAPAHGVLSGFNAATGAVTYTPNTGYQGPDSFTFTVTNGTNTSSAAIVSLTVAAGIPTANAQAVNVAFNTAKGMTLTGSDPDVPALTLTFNTPSAPAHGVLSGFNAATGAVTYTPNTGYQGPDSFKFTVTNGTNTSSVATVSLTVAAGVPTANAQAVNVAFNTAKGITLTGSDPDVPALVLTFNTPSVPAHGVLSGFNAATGAVTYTPDAGYQGPDSFTFAVTNGTNTSSAATVSLTVLPNPPPVFSSGPTATPNPAQAGKVVQFAVVASDALPVAYAWSFGDGTTGSGDSISHVFSSKGSYTVTVTATDATNGTTTATVTVQVDAVIGTPGPGNTLLPGETDSDGDGFSDEVEASAGTDPSDLTATPLTDGKSSSLQPPQLLIAPVLKITTKSKTLKLTGSVKIPKGFAPLDKLVVVNVGGFLQKFTLSKNGKGKTGKDSFTVHLKAVKGVVNDQTAKFSLTLNDVPVSVSSTSEILLLMDGLIFTRH